MLQSLQSPYFNKRSFSSLLLNHSSYQLLTFTTQLLSLPNPHIPSYEAFRSTVVFQQSDFSSKPLFEQTPIFIVAIEPLIPPSSTLHQSTLFPPKPLHTNLPSFLANGWLATRQFLFGAKSRILSIWKNRPYLGILPFIWSGITAYHSGPCPCPTHTLVYLSPQRFICDIAFAPFDLNCLHLAILFLSFILF